MNLQREIDFFFALSVHMDIFPRRFILIDDNDPCKTEKRCSHEIEFHVIYLNLLNGIQPNWS